MRLSQLPRFLDAQFDDTLALWIVVQILVRRLLGRRLEAGSDVESDSMLLTVVATRRKLAAADVWN